MQAKRPQGNETTNPNEEGGKGPPYELTPPIPVHSQIIAKIPSPHNPISVPK